VRLPAEAGSRATTSRKRFLVALNTSGVRYLLVATSAALLQGAGGAAGAVAPSPDLLQR